MLALGLALTPAALPQQSWETFEMRQLSNQFFSEGACGADFDGV